MKFLSSCSAIVICFLAIGQSTATAAIAFSTQPTSNVILLPGDSKTLKAVAIGTGITYQWFRDQVALDGATKTALVVSLPGVYYCRANGISSATSTVVSHLAPTSIPMNAKLTLKGVFTGTGFHVVNGVVQFQDPPEFVEAFTDESDVITFLTATSVSDPDGDEFSLAYKKTDAWTAKITYVQTKNTDGTLASENSRRIQYLKFLSFDASNRIYYGTFSSYDKSFEGYITGSGVFTLSVP